MIGYERETLARLPLAEAAYRLLDYVSHEDVLNAIFQEHRGRSYAKVIDFPTLVQLVAAALLEHRGSGHRSFARARAAGALKTSLKAAYGKLARVPLPLSQALLAETSQRLLEVRPRAAASTLPACLHGLTVLLVDGKKIKHVAHRLKVLRPLRGQVLAAKLLLALNLETGLAVAFSAHPDGEAGETPLVPALLAQTRPRTPGPRLWVLDRAFCDLTQPPLLSAAGDHFLIRYSAKVSFEADPARPARSGTDAAGRPYREEWGWLGGGAHPRRQYVRRITLPRAAAEAVVLVTDLLDAERYPAADLLTVYRDRWGIEQVFQQITEVFHLRRLIGSTPQAGVFQAAFCLLLYNVLVVIRAFLSAARPEPAVAPAAISTATLFDDMHRDLVALHEVLAVPEIVAAFAERLPGQELRRYLSGRLAGVWSATWTKAPTKPRSAAKKTTTYLKGGHDSVYRLLQKSARRAVRHPRRQ